MPFTPDLDAFIKPYPFFHDFSRAVCRSMRIFDIIPHKVYDIYV